MCQQRLCTETVVHHYLNESWVSLQMCFNSRLCYVCLYNNYAIAWLGLGVTPSFCLFKLTFLCINYYNIIVVGCKPFLDITS